MRKPLPIRIAALSCGLLGWAACTADLEGLTGGSPETDAAGAGDASKAGGGGKAGTSPNEAGSGAGAGTGGRDAGADSREEAASVGGAPPDANESASIGGAGASDGSPDDGSSGGTGLPDADSASAGAAGADAAADVVVEAAPPDVVCTCGPLPHATGKCNTADAGADGGDSGDGGGEACVVASCDPEHANCDGKSANGCETTLGSSEHCSSCEPCAGGGVCAGGVCHGYLSVAVGDWTSFAVLENGDVYGWGRNDQAQLGQGDQVTPHKTAVPIDVPGKVVQIDGGRWHTCARNDAGEIYCWGRNLYGEVGIDSSAIQKTPALALTDAADVAVGDDFTCARKTGTYGAQALCWGHDLQGALGNGIALGNSDVPDDVTGLDDALSVTAGERHACVVRRSGQAACWGWGAFGQIGDDDTDDEQLFVSVKDLPNATSIAAGSWHTCAVRTGGALWCWGHDGYGALGIGASTGSPDTPQLTNLTDVAAVSAGRHFTCAMTTLGDPYCWGRNVWGEVGDDSETERTTPVPLSGLPKVRNIAAGGSETDDSAHACALGADDVVYCWGHGGYGEIGDGAIENRKVPTEVQGLP